MKIEKCLESNFTNLPKPRASGTTARTFSFDSGGSYWPRYYSTGHLVKNPNLPYGHENLRAFLSRFYLGSSSSSSFKFQVQVQVDPSCFATNWFLTQCMSQGSPGRIGPPWQGAIKQSNRVSKHSFQWIQQQQQICCYTLGIQCLGKFSLTAGLEK